MSNKNPKISVVMPALNEEKNIADAVDNVLRSLDDFNIAGELIVINDGSTDKTEDLIKAIMKNDSRVSMVKHEKPKGIGASFWDGVDSAKGDACIMMPGDNENDLSEMLRYAGLMDSVDMVIPFTFNKQARSALRNIVSFFYKTIINATFFTSLNYTNGTVMYRTIILKGLEDKQPGFFFQADALIKLIKAGYLFAEVPYRLGRREKGRSKAISLRSFYRVVKGYLRLFIYVYFKAGKKRGIFLDGSISKKRYA